MEGIKSFGFGFVTSVICPDSLEGEQGCFLGIRDVLVLKEWGNAGGWQQSTENPSPSELCGLQIYMTYLLGSLECLYRLLIAYSFILSMDEETLQRIRRLVFLLKSDSESVESISQQLQILAYKDKENAKSMLLMLKQLMLSPNYKERISAEILLDSILKVFPVFSAAAYAFSLPIAWQSFSARGIRKIQKWLTSDRSVDEVDSSESMSSIRSKLKTVLEEEVEESKDLEGVLDEAQNMMDIEPADGLVNRIDLTCNSSTHDEDNAERPQWLNSLLSSIIFDHSNVSDANLLGDIFLSCLRHCLDVSWEHRHGSFLVLSTFLKHYHFDSDVSAVIFFILVAALFSDCFIDASFDLYQVPVRETICQCLKLVVTSPTWSDNLVLVIKQLHQVHDWKKSEEWIWLYDLVLAAGVVDCHSSAMVSMVMDWFRNGDYATQGLAGELLCRWLKEDPSILVMDDLSELRHFIVNQLSSHNFLSEWNCALESYFYLLSYVPPQDECIWDDVLIYLQNSLFGIRRKDSFLTLIAFYSLYHSERVRKAVYICLQHFSSFFPCDECSLLLLMDAVVCESSSLQAVAFNTLCSLAQTVEDKVSSESCLLAAMKSGRFVDESRLLGVAPFIGKVADISGWCFVQQQKKVNKELLNLCLCLVHALWGQNNQFGSDPLKDQVLILSEQQHVLQWLCTVQLGQSVTIPSVIKSDHSHACSSVQSIEYSNDMELQSYYRAIKSSLSRYPTLMDSVVPVLLDSNEENVTAIVDEFKSSLTSEDDLISLILLKKYIRSFYERKRRLDKDHEGILRSYHFLCSLNHYYQEGDKDTLKHVLAEVHHVLPLLSSFVFTAVCCALPLPSTRVSTRVMANICRLNTECGSLRAITIFMRRLLHSDQFNDVHHSINELIFRGLDGNEQDQLKSIAVFQAVVNGINDNSILQDLITVFNKVSLKCPTQDSVHPVITGLKQCAIDEVSGPFVEHLCSILLSDPSKTAVVHSIDMLLLLYHKHTSTLIMMLYSLLVIINTKLSLYNAEPHVHSRLLRLLTVLLPLEDLEPTFQDSKQCDLWVNTKKEYETYNNQYSHYELPFKPLLPLRAYQIDGVRWLLRNCLTGISSGGILGDEMGLGKTVQAAVAVACCDESLPSVVVTPKSLLLNWKTEIEKFIPDDRVDIMIFNPSSVTHDEELSDMKSKLKPHSLVLLTYPTLRNELNKANSLFSIHFSCCILDEGHFIRNHQSRLHFAVCKINANHRIVLTGTPIQNYLEDIFGIFEFIAPGYFNNYEQFYDEYVKPIIRSYHKKNQSSINAANECIEALNQAVRPFLLRRTKKEVHLELPEKILCDIVCPMTDCQSVVLNTFREWVNSGVAEEAARGQVLQQSIAIATHPSLCGYMDSMFLPFTIINQLQTYSCSGKFAALKLLIDKILHTGDFVDAHVAPSGKMIVFSQKPQCLELITSQLLSYYQDLHYLTMTSELSVKKRMEIVDSFQTDSDIHLLLATTGVCGHGFTLTAASTVVVVDHNFNPYVDMQAIDRCHRLGQDSTVNVYRLVSDEPNESRLMNLQRFKEYIATTVVKTEQGESRQSAVLSELERQRDFSNDSGKRVKTTE